MEHILHSWTNYCEPENKPKHGGYLTADDTPQAPFNQNLNRPALMVIRILLSFSLRAYLPAGCDEK